MTPDVNVLVAGFRADHSHHETARTGLTKARRDCSQGSESLTLLSMVVTGFVRLVTNRRVFIDPDSVEDAIAFIDTVLESPATRSRPHSASLNGLTPAAQRTRRSRQTMQAGV
ncbi:MAG: hypothetical protein ACKVQU_20615 [Burkholderiales bacterium]